MRYTVADLPESGRWVVVDETSGRWVYETTDADKAERRADDLNAREDFRASLRSNAAGGA